MNKIWDVNSMRKLTVEKKSNRLKYEIKQVQLG